MLLFVFPALLRDSLPQLQADNAGLPAYFASNLTAAFRAVSMAGSFLLHRIETQFHGKHLDRR